MNTIKKLEKQNKYHAQAINILVAIFFLAVGFGVSWSNITSILLGMICLQLSISLNTARRQNKIMIYLEEMKTNV